MTFSEAGPVPAQGNIAQQIFWYTAFTADMIKPGLPVVNADGTPKWRMAPSPHGPYWKEGMKLGYQDVGSWTLLKSTPVERRKAAWLYAQFMRLARRSSLKKSHVGLTFIRESDIWRQELHRARAQARRPGRVLPLARRASRGRRPAPTCPTIRSWRSSGGRTSARPSSGEKTPQAAMDTLAEEQDQVLARLERRVQGECGPKLNPKGDRRATGSKRQGRRQHRAAAKLANEKPKGETIDYDTLIKSGRRRRRRSRNDDGAGRRFLAARPFFDKTRRGGPCVSDFVATRRCAICFLRPGRRATRCPTGCARCRRWPSATAMARMCAP